MSLFSHPIEIQPSKELKKPINQKPKQTAPFPKKEKKGKLPSKMEEGALEALKEMLARQKHSTDALHAMSAASPFSDRALMQQLSIDATSQVPKVEPTVQFMQLFEKIVSSLIHLDQSGIRETTIFLDSEEFSSSIFQGAKITITEYSTAPKVFNIQFSADPEALSFFQAHAGDLIAAFQRGKFAFEVERIDSGLFSEEKPHPIVQRDLQREDHKQ